MLECLTIMLIAIVTISPSPLRLVHPVAIRLMGEVGATD